MTYRARSAYNNPEEYDRHRTQGGRHRRIAAQEDRLLERAFLEAGSPGDTVLDLACGSGRITEQLAAKAVGVTGFDISEAMLAGARRRLEHSSVVRGFVRGDSVALPFKDRSFDGITSFRLMGHLPPPIRTAALREIARVARHWVILTHNHLWCVEGLSNLPGRWLRRVGQAGAATLQRRPLSWKAMREELAGAGLVVEWIQPCRRGWDEECVLLARPCHGDPARRELAWTIAAAPGERLLPGRHRARLVSLEGGRYVVKLERESLLEFILYCGRVLQLNWFAADVVRPLGRRARIRAAVAAMEEWHSRGFAAPRALSGPTDDFLCYPYLSFPGLRACVGEAEQPLRLVELVAAEIYRRHQAAGESPAGRECLLFHLDSRWDNILMDGEQPVWIDFDRGFRRGTPPELLKSRELVTFCRSVLRHSPPGQADSWLRAVVRSYPDPGAWQAAIRWLLRASAASQGPIAWFKERHDRAFHSRHRLASRLRAAVNSPS